MTIAFSTTVRNAQADAITTAMGANGLLNIYNGARPASGGAATTLLAQLTCGSPFAPAAVNGILTLNAVTADASANATGTATWARFSTSGGTFVMDMTVGQGAGDLSLNEDDIVAGGNVSISTPRTITIGNA